MRKAGSMEALLGFMRNVLWPPASLLGDDWVDRPGLIDAASWAKLQFLTPLWCDACGFPLPDLSSEAEILADEDQFDAALRADEPPAQSPISHHGPDLCLACIAHPPAFDHAVAALAYDAQSRPLILALKHGGRRDGLKSYVMWLHQTLQRAHAYRAPGSDPPLGFDFIIPVPLHYWRLVRRGYNQAGLLAQGLARQLEAPVRYDLLVRARRTPSQEGRSAAARLRNMQGAFKVPRSAQARLVGTRLLLVDDVFTTGATLEACARALKRAGAKEVHCVALARVLRPRPVRAWREAARDAEAALGRLSNREAGS